MARLTVGTSSLLKSLLCQPLQNRTENAERPTFDLAIAQAASDGYRVSDDRINFIHVAPHVAEPRL